MKRTLTSSLLFAVAIATARCGGDMRSGSESHFLGECVDERDCAAGLDCVCNVCTPRCTVNADCQASSPVSTCAAPNALVPGCGVSGSVCQIACTASSDCSSPDLECRQGTCRFRAAGGDAGGTGGAGQGGSAGDGSTVTPPACDADGGECLCNALVTCGDDERMEALPLGSRGYRVCGTAGDGCVVSYFTETEGGVSMYRCYADRVGNCGSNPWANLDAMPCDLVGSCNALLGTCPTDLLDCNVPDPAPSCQAIDPGVDACCAGFAVSLLTNACNCVCPTVSAPLYGTLESCQAACGSPPLTCKALDPYSFGDCNASLGYGYDGVGCISVSGCGANPDDGLFLTRDECWQGCSKSCTDVEARRVEVVAQAKACQSNDDCMWVESGGPPYDHCSCLVAVNRNLDIGAWRNLNFAYGCFEQGGCCDAPPPPAVCTDGKCAAGTF